MFIPVKQTNLSLLESICMEDLIKRRFNKLAEYCGNALNYLENQKVLVVNGTKKHEITQWWLQVISDNVRSFLQGISYDFTAVRYDYIETPPDDLVAVRKNLQVVRAILNTKEDKYNVQGLLKSILSVVYPKIDLFIKNACVTLCDKISLSEEEFTVEKAFQLLEEMNLPKDDDTENLLKDIQYLETIKKLEVEKPSGKGDLNVVPISGLVM